MFLGFYGQTRVSLIGQKSYLEGPSRDHNHGVAFGEQQLAVLRSAS